MLLILAFPLRQSIEITKIQLVLLVNGSFQFVAVYPSYKAMGLLRTAHRIFHASAIETAREYEWLSLTHCMNFPFASKTGCHTTIAKYSLNRLRYPWLAYRVCIFTPTRPCLRCFYHFPWTRGDRGKQTEKKPYPFSTSNSNASSVPFSMLFPSHLAYHWLIFDEKQPNQNSLSA